MEQTKNNETKYDMVQNVFNHLFELFYEEVADRFDCLYEKYEEAIEEDDYEYVDKYDWLIQNYDLLDEIDEPWAYRAYAYAEAIAVLICEEVESEKAK